MSVDLFKEIVPAILMTKKDVLPEEESLSYVPFIVNRALSFHYDCILYANEMNKNHQIDHRLQFLYLLNTVRSYKRPFQKWLKREVIEDLESIKEYYNCSNEKAKVTLRILSADQINEIKNRLKKGGLKNDKSQRTSGGNT
jgi:hypothetical protein